MTTWWTGRARYRLLYRPDGVHSTLITAVECRLEEGAPQWAMLDTGAEWSTIGGGEARRLHALVGSEGPPLPMGTRFGTVSGTLERVRVSFEAAQGANLVLDATILLAPEWPGPPVIGTRLLLEYVRFELHPDANGDAHWWAFAHADPDH